MSELPMLSAVRIEADRVVLRKARDTDRDAEQTLAAAGLHSFRAGTSRPRGAQTRS